MFKYSRKNSTLRGKLVLDPLDVIIIIIIIK